MDSSIGVSAAARALLVADAALGVVVVVVDCEHDPHRSPEYDLPGTPYGTMLLPHVVTATTAALLGAG